MIDYSIIKHFWIQEIYELLSNVVYGIRRRIVSVRFHLQILSLLLFRQLNSRIKLHRQFWAGGSNFDASFGTRSAQG